jgi:hypothetical protein
MSSSDRPNEIIKRAKKKLGIVFRKTVFKKSKNIINGVFRSIFPITQNHEKKA